MFTFRSCEKKHILCNDNEFLITVAPVDHIDYMAETGKVQKQTNFIILKGIISVSLFDCKTFFLQT